MRLFSPTPTPPAHRPLLARFRSAPAAVGGRRGPTDYFTFPRRPEPVTRRLGRAVHERFDEAQDRAEAGCLRLMLRAVRWWVWRRWRQ